MDSLPKEKFDISLIPYDVFGLSQEEKQKLRDLLASYGFSVRLSRWEDVKGYNFPNYDSIVKSGVYTTPEFRYLFQAAVHCITDFRCHYFKNGELVCSEEAIKVEEENKKRWDKEFNAVQKNK